MAKLILSLFDCISWALRRAGVDYPQFRSLLGVKLTLDGRRRFTAFQQRGGKAPRNAFAGALLMNAFMGFFVAMLLLIASPLAALMLVHAFVMVVIALSLIADFSSVLLDTTDNQILQSRPITSRTILAARLAHVSTYVSLLTLSLAAASFFVGTVKYGVVFVPVFALTLVAAVCLIVGAVNVLYLLAMRLTSGERLRDIILYFQVGMTVLVIGGYQVLPRLMDMKQLATWRLADHWWVYLIPPAWFAAPVELLTSGPDTPQLVLTTLGIVAPLGMLAAALRLAPGFKEALARLEAAPESSKDASLTTGRRGRRLSLWLTRRPVERAAFDFLWCLAGRDRQFKLRTYPNIAMVFIFGALMMFTGSKGLRQTLSSLPQTHKDLLLLYMCCALAPTALLQIRYSDGYEAAWIYRAAPLANPGEVLLAAWKVVVARIVLPAFALVAVTTLVIWRASAIPDVLLAFCATLVVCALHGLLIGDRLPFSEPLGTMESSGRASRVIVYMFLAMAFGGLHYALTFVPHGVAIAIPAAALATWLALRAYGRTSWGKILAREEPSGTPTTGRQRSEKGRGSGAPSR